MLQMGHKQLQLDFLNEFLFQYDGSTLVINQKFSSFIYKMLIVSYISATISTVTEVYCCITQINSLFFHLHNMQKPYLNIEFL